MMHAELCGIVCSGARQGNQFTYALLDEIVQPFRVKEKTRDEALAELTKRYFRSRGPATLKDFSTWSGMTLSDCRKDIEMVKSHFVKEVIEKVEYYFTADTSFTEKQFCKVHLLPIYDEFIMGYKNRDAIFQFMYSIKPTPVFRFACTIVFEGQIIGTWKRILKQKNIHIEYDFFKPLNKIQKTEFENAILRFKEFTGAEIEFYALK